MTKKLVCAGICALLLSSCTISQPLYSWYDYESITYQYSKSGSEQQQAKVLEQYAKMLQKQNGSRGVVPPGLNAEYGFLLCKTGKKQEGLTYLQEEIKLYPESEKYISRIIKQLEK